MLHVVQMSKAAQLHRLLSASNFAQVEQHFKTSFAKLWPSSWAGVTVGVTSDGKYLSISRLESRLSAPVVLLLPWADEGSAASTGAVKAERSAAVTESSPHSSSTAAGRDDGQRETGRRARQQSVDGLVCSDAAFVEEPSPDGLKGTISDRISISVGAAVLICCHDGRSTVLQKCQAKLHRHWILFEL